MTIADSRVVAWEQRYLPPKGDWSRWMPTIEQAYDANWTYDNAIATEYRQLVPLSLLAEAEERRDHWHDYSARRVEEIAALQSRLDAVGRLVGELVALAKAHEIKADRPAQHSDENNWHAGFDEGVTECVTRIRAALGCATTGEMK